MQLSPHFTYDEAITSQTAARLGLRNVPPPDVLNNMVHAAQSMERIRHVLGDKPISISSWYRAPEVNKAVGGSATSAHVYGWAIDFNCHAYGPLVDLIVAVANSDVPFDQVIWEFDSWCHISFSPSLRGQVLTIRNGTGYMPGIILP